MPRQDWNVEVRVGSVKLPAMEALEILTLDCHPTKSSNIILSIKPFTCD